jgi:5-methylcytosine-specific restriction endonuclease McrA
MISEMIRQPEVSVSLATLGLLAMAFSKTVREEVRRRQGWMCDATGKFTEQLQIHHRLPHCRGGDDTIENAVGLCPEAHHEADMLAIKAGVIYPQRHWKDGYYPEGKDD